ncbi:hypothetical protein AncyloWKF20_05135 [Ancylobacter sp. WKF20]|uniref:hypothetical protein n=1 Tax=Ancylobacter sp. WKF20 TaxID=3039801 RepID=UPI0024342A49|nr:hypothetical protein [Ancylobacter sp. WKF20]WGD31208.1 hypothetical protein AncyloWKF20_05135 [Ancylobacter sp. WKF20]
MADIEIRMNLDNVLGRFANQLGHLRQKEMNKILQRGLARTGNKAKTQVIRSLTGQTGLRRQVLVRAVRFRKPSWEDLSYDLVTQGGLIALKYFRPRETGKGVSAAPQGGRRVFPSTFMRAGWWPHRVDKPEWGGHVFERTGEKTANGKDAFRKVKSDVRIPDEMLRGETLARWRDVVERDLEKDVAHQIEWALKTGK